MKSQLSLDPQGRNHIRSVSAEGLRIGDAVYAGSVIVAPDAVIEDWPPASLESLEEEHFSAVLAFKPEVVLLGTGATQRFLHPGRLAPLYRAGIGVETMTTAAACRTYNILVAEERRVVAALLPHDA
ncbi:MAG: Mth938-like domain-containing protein [Xanthomonadales bacterium]|jgi:uncharacterized protein|nr:Mth938-like domain-containing protein [Xanthomonadales bacterium]